MVFKNIYIFVLETKVALILERSNHQILNCSDDGFFPFRPGTTMNLLKFPIVDPAPWRLARRTQRIIKQRTEEVQELRLLQQASKNLDYTQYGDLTTLLLGLQFFYLFPVTVWKK